MVDVKCLSINTALADTAPYPLWRITEGDLPALRSFDQQVILRFVRERQGFVQIQRDAIGATLA